MVICRPGEPPSLAVVEDDSFAVERPPLTGRTRRPPRKESLVWRGICFCGGSTPRSPDIHWDGDAELKERNRRRFSLLAASIDLRNAGGVDMVKAMPNGFVFARSKLDEDRLICLRGHSSHGAWLDGQRSDRFVQQL
jgi:hypothetical protein